MAREGCTFGKRPCMICGKHISRNGLAMHGHMRAHIAAGEMVKTKYMVRQVCGEYRDLYGKAGTDISKWRVLNGWF